MQILQRNNLRGASENDSCEVKRAAEPTNQIFRKWYTCSLQFVCVLLTLLSFTSHASAQDVNVLIIGSNKDSSEYSTIAGTSGPFDPAEIKTYLENILNGDATVGNVNVAVEERYHLLGSNSCYNLGSWFHWPYKANGNGDGEDPRWQNLRGASGTAWDYVILIGDPYTMEYMPGFYSYGVSQVGREVAKGSAETILLMPWPNAGSTSSVNHYKEVVYRTGRSGGYKVAPAALAWQVLGSPSTVSTHPNNDGAFIAASSIYSRIWNKSASTSSYTYNDTMADTVSATVQANTLQANPVVQQYTGKFNFQNPFLMFDDKRRNLKTDFGNGWSSTEDFFLVTARDAMKVGSRVNDSGARAYNLGRNSPKPAQKGYNLDPAYPLVFGHNFRTRLTRGDPVDEANDYHIAQIFSQDTYLAENLIGQSDSARSLPWRLLMAQVHREYPTRRPLADGAGHLDALSREAGGYYMQTLFSGRCPLDTKPEPMTQTWMAQKIGYETAWNLGCCQSRAPGFKVLPSDRQKLSIVTGGSEMMTVQFILPPESNVTVNISTSGSAPVSLSKTTLVFTPQNYDVPQQVIVTANGGQPSNSDFNVVFSTSSDDVVYEGLDDSWKYTYIANTLPVANDQTAKGVKNQLEVITLTGSDTNNHPLTYEVVTGPTSGVLAGNTPNLVYTPNLDFVGTDSFTFRINDGFGNSTLKTATIIVVESNNAPVVSAGADQSVELGSGDYPWTPIDNTTNIAWYDASDASSITHSGGVVSNLKNKAGITTNLSQGTANSRPTTGIRTQNNLNVLDFDGGDFMVGSSFNSPKIGDLAVFTVAGVDVINNSWDAIITLDSNDESDYMSFLPNSANTFNGRIGTGNQGSKNLSGGPFNGPSIYGMTIDFTVDDPANQNTTMTAHIDGNQKMYSKGYNFQMQPMERILLMAKPGNAAQKPDGFVGEVLVTDDVSTGTRQIIEGYLAHKWGLDSSLPAVHPYKVTAPLINAANANLNGSASDADGEPLTTTWTIQSQPSGAETTIIDPSALDTAVLFRSPGVYVLRLTADDGIDQVWEETTITVTPPLGAGPVTQFGIHGVGSNQSVGVPIPGITFSAQNAAGEMVTSFTGNVDFVGTGGFTGTSANFVGGFLTESVVTPTSSGNNLTLTVNNGAGITGSTTIATIGSLFNQWVATGGGGGDNSFGRDQNGDGVVNGMAWVLGADDPSSNATAMLPTVDADTDVDYLIYSYRRSDAAFTVLNNNINVQYGSDLNNWVTAVHNGTTVIISSIDDHYGTGIDKVEVKVAKSLAGNEALFMHLRVVEN